MNDNARPRTKPARAIPTAQRGEALGAVPAALSVFRQAVTAIRVSGSKTLRGTGRRERTNVASEYDGGNWKQILDERRWERVENPHHYVVPRDESARIAKIDGKIVKISTRDYYEFRLAKLQDAIGARAADVDHLTELGCGWGANLFSLSLLRRWKRLSGFDISSNGVEATNLAAAHFGLDYIHARRLDLTNAADPAFAALRGSTAFSYLCLEQLKYATSGVVENLLRAGVRRMIHIEPVPEVMSRWRLGDVANRLYIAAHDYQDNLLSTLRSFERARRVRVLEVSRLSFSPQPVNDPSLIVWEPT